MKKTAIITLILFLIFTLSFLIADHLGYLDTGRIQGWFSDLSATGHGRVLGAAAVVFFLVIDLILPVPSSIIMTMSGMILGTVYGGLFSFVGAMLAAVLGFWLCRWGGHAVFVRFVGAEDTNRIDQWFKSYGVYAIIISRPIPMLTEILSCLAGLSGFPFRPFLLSSILGTLPICFIYSFVGQMGSIKDPWPAIWVALVIPALGWMFTRKIKSEKTEDDGI